MVDSPHLGSQQNSSRSCKAESLTKVYNKLNHRIMCMCCAEHVHASVFEYRSCSAWINLGNMGCQLTTFKTRRLELALLNGKVTDDDVVESFRQCANPEAEDPFVLDLLRLGKLAAVIGDTLFVHADIPEQTLGFVPDSEELIRAAGPGAVRGARAGGRPHSLGPQPPPQGPGGWKGEGGWIGI